MLLQLSKLSNTDIEKYHIRFFFNVIISRLPLPCLCSKQSGKSDPSEKSENLQYKKTADSVLFSLFMGTNVLQLSSIVKRYMKDLVKTYFGLLKVQMKF